MSISNHYKHAISLVTSALKGADELPEVTRNFYINYIAKVITKLWSEKHIGVSPALKKSAAHPCTQKLVSSTLARLVNRTKTMIESQIEDRPAYLEKERIGYAYIDSALQISNPVPVDESARRLVELVTTLGELPPFVMAEFAAVVDLAKTFAFGFLSVNREWFKFDKSGMPVEIEDRVVGRLFYECGFQKESEQLSAGTLSAEEMNAARKHLLDFIKTYKEERRFSNNENTNNNNNYFNNNNMISLTRRHKPAAAVGGRRRRATRRQRSKGRQN